MFYLKFLCNSDSEKLAITHQVLGCLDPSGRGARPAHGDECACVVFQTPIEDYHVAQLVERYGLPSRPEDLASAESAGSGVAVAVLVSVGDLILGFLIRLHEKF